MAKKEYFGEETKATTGKTATTKRKYTRKAATTEPTSAPGARALTKRRTKSRKGNGVPMVTITVPASLAFSIGMLAGSASTNT